MNNLLNLSNNEISVIKQIINERKYFVKDIKLPLSRAMKYRIIKGLEKKGIVSIDFVRTDDKEYNQFCLSVLSKDGLMNLLDFEVNKLYKKKEVLEK